MFLKGDNKGAETHKNVCVYCMWKPDIVGLLVAISAGRIGDANVVVRSA